MRKIILVFIFLISVSFVLAQNIPSPHAFHGEIIVKDGSNPNGLTLIGKINGIATGSCIIEENSYDIIVTDYSGTGGYIEFYIGNEKAKEISEFITFKVTELDLTFNTIPLELGNCGNGVCEDNDCSVCPVDCKISECIGNGICDLEIGESCLTAPDDCACSSGYECINRICKKKDTDSSNGNSGDDGSSSSDPSSSSIQDLITNASDSQNDILSIESLNEADKEGGTGAGITGAIIGFVGSGTGTVLIFVLLVILLSIGVMMLKKKSPKNE